jgi:hypothetical protein
MLLASDSMDWTRPHGCVCQGLVGAGADPAALQPQGAVPTALEEIAMYLWGAPGGAPSRLLRCRVAGEAEQFAQVEQLLAGMMSKQGARLSAREQKEVAAAFEVKGGRTFFAVPSQTNYVAQVSSPPPLRFAVQVRSHCTCVLLTPQPVLAKRWDEKSAELEML